MTNGRHFAGQSDPGRNPNFSRRWTEPPHCGTCPAASSAAAEIVANVRFRQQVERLHALGPRVTAELLAEIGTERSIMPIINAKLQTYAEIDPEALRALGGDKFWLASLREVGR